VLPEELGRRGARVEVVPAYRTVKAPSDPEAVRAMLREGDIHAVTFTSSSTVTRFLELIGPDAVGLLKRVVVASIGPITAETAARAGVVSQVVPGSYTVPALTEALIRFLRPSKS
ncbi:MAG TPA: uroporphyrinogen-III synthase, partial [Candidatus Sulfotelmatobacter sp.]|nr:uroporphyrinogen-III synthase [Candidatus Sulfotelmatobacter sp.]